MSDLRIPIDDLTWADLRTLALERIPSASRGRWTLHGPVDPGVTLLELFAWQLEQRLYLAEQLPDDVVLAALALLGAPAPASATAARTVLAFRAAPAHRLATDTPVLLADDPDGRRFALCDDVWVLPVERVAVDGRLAAAGDVLELRPVGGGPSGAAGAALTLLVEVDAAPGVAPGWSSAAVAVPPPVVLRFTAVGPGGGTAPADVVDGTGGLRRSGLLRLPWPAVWDEPGGGGPRLRVTVERGGYPEPVRVLGVHPNAVLAEHRVTATVVPATAGLRPLPGQRLAVPGAAGLLLDAVLELRERDGERHRWATAPSWVGAGPGDRHLVADRATGVLVFGDGRAGRIPRPHADPEPVLRVGLGGGAAGNVGPHRGWVAGADEAVNPVAADGGAEAEPLAAARQQTADALARADRTVTAADVRDLAESTPGVGVARAHVAAGRHPDFPCVAVAGALTVTVVPDVDRDGPPATWTAAPQPDDGLLTAVDAGLQEARLVGQEVFVARPEYAAVRVTVTVDGPVDPPARQAVSAALARWLDPLCGGAEGRGWPFGGTLRPSELLGVAQRELGPEVSVTRVAIRLGDGPAQSCADTPLSEGVLVRLDGVTLDAPTAASAATAGGLR